MVDIVTAVSALSSSIALVREIRDAKVSLDQAELKSRMAELYSSLADAKMALADAQQALRDKDVEIEKLRNAFVFKEKTVRFGGVSYEAGQDGKPIGDPFCPRCETRGDFHRIRDRQMKTGGWERYCPNCKSEYARLTVFLYPPKDEGVSDVDH